MTLLETISSCDEQRCCEAATTLTGSDLRGRSGEDAAYGACFPGFGPGFLGLGQPASRCDVLILKVLAASCVPHNPPALREKTAA